MPTEQEIIRLKIQQEILAEAKLMKEIKDAETAVGDRADQHQRGIAVIPPFATAAAGNANGANAHATESAKNELRAVVEKARIDALAQHLDGEATRNLIREKIADARAAGGLIDVAALAGGDNRNANGAHTQAQSNLAARTAGHAHDVNLTLPAAAIAPATIADSQALMDQAALKVLERERANKLAEKGTPLSAVENAAIDANNAAAKDLAITEVREGAKALVVNPLKEILEAAKLANPGWHMIAPAAVTAAKANLTAAEAAPAPALGGPIPLNAALDGHLNTSMVKSQTVIDTFEQAQATTQATQAEIADRTTKEAFVRAMTEALAPVIGRSSSGKMKKAFQEPGLPPEELPGALAYINGMSDGKDLTKAAKQKCDIALSNINKAIEKHGHNDVEKANLGELATRFVHAKYEKATDIHEDRSEQIDDLEANMGRKKSRIQKHLDRDATGSERIVKMLGKKQARLEAAGINTHDDAVDDYKKKRASAIDDVGNMTIAAGIIMCLAAAALAIFTGGAAIPLLLGAAVVGIGGVALKVAAFVSKALPVIERGPLGTKLEWSEKVAEQKEVAQEAVEQAKTKAESFAEVDIKIDRSKDTRKQVDKIMEAFEDIGVKDHNKRQFGELVQHNVAFDSFHKALMEDTGMNVGGQMSASQIDLGSRALGSFDGDRTFGSILHDNPSRNTILKPKTVDMLEEIKGDGHLLSQVQDERTSLRKAIRDAGQNRGDGGDINTRDVNAGWMR